MATLHLTTPRVPSGIATTTPVTLSTSFTTPQTSVPYHISAPALRASLLNHSLFACPYTLATFLTCASTSAVKPFL